MLYQLISLLLLGLIAYKLFDIADILEDKIYKDEQEEEE